MTNRRSLGAIAQWRIMPWVMLLTLGACRGDAARTTDSSSARSGSGAGDVTFIRSSPTDFAALRWIEGDWRGQIPSGAYFYERYKFSDDSTIVMRGFEDPAFSRPNDSATIVFRNGVVTDRGGKARWSATRLDANGIDFAPAEGASNRFSWNRKSADAWTAEISPVRGNPTVYQMERVRPK